MAFPIGWSGDKIMIKINGGFNDKDLIDFPLHIRGFDSKLFIDSIMYNNAKDIRFTSDVLGVNVLDCKILNEYKLDVIVNVPFVSSNNGATLYMWWGNPNATLINEYIRVKNPYHKGRLVLSFQKMY